MQLTHERNEQLWAVLTKVDNKYKLKTKLYKSEECAIADILFFDGEELVDIFPVMVNTDGTGMTCSEFKMKSYEVK